MRDETSVPPQGRYRPGDVLEIEVEGYEPLRFAVSLRAYRRFQKASKKDLGVHAHNLLRESALDWPRLEPLLDVESPEFDMTLSDVLIGELAAAIGLGRDSAAKKLTRPPGS